MNQRGFTLLELLVVMLIIGILATLTYPSFSQHIAKARRAQAKVNLVALAAELEKSYVLHHRYEIPAHFEQSQEFYNYVIQLNKNDYTISAQPKGRQQADACGILSLNNLGQRMAATDTTSHCW